MGIFRLFLALSVLNAHYPLFAHGPNPLIHPFIAVLVFFMVSGFYMAMVIEEKYSKRQNGIRRFYLNRALRLYPTYWIVLGLTMALAAADMLAFTIKGIGNPGQVAAMQHSVWLVVKQLTLLPYAVQQMFMGRGGGGLVAGQMFTVSLELLFYLVAPLLLYCRRWMLVTVVAIAAFLHVLPYILDLPPRPWQYEFFPSIFFFFVLGHLSYLGYQHIRSADYPAWLGYLCLAALAGYALLFSDAMWKNFTNDWAAAGYYALVAISIPFLFRASQHSGIDRFIGDLSYPVYVCHFLVICVVEKFGPADALSRAQAGWLAVLAFALLLTVAVERPLQAIRK